MLGHAHLVACAVKIINVEIRLLTACDCIFLDMFCFLIVPL